MAIYINKEIDIYNYEVELSFDESELLQEMDNDTVLEHVVDHCSASDILDKLDASDIIAHVAGDKQALAALLRAIADQLQHQ